MANESARLWNKNFILIMLASTGVSFASAFFASTMPLYAERISGSTGWAGAITGAFAFAALASRAITGFFIDRVKRSVIALIGAAICLLACVFYSFAGVIAALILLRAVHGFGFGINSTASNTIAVDMIPASRRVEGIGIYGLCMTLSMAAAPAIALPLIMKQNGLAKLSAITSVFMIMTFISLVLIKYEKPAHHAKVHSHHTADIHTKSYIKNAVIPSSMILLFSMVQGAIISFIALYAIDKGFESIGFFFTCSAAGTIVSRLFTGKLGDRHGINAIIWPSLFLFLLSLLGITFAPTELMIVLMGVPYGFAIGTAMPAFNVMILNIFPEKRRGAANSLYFACIDLGIGGGSIFWGLMADTIEYKGVFIGASVTSAVLFVLFLLYHYIGRRKPALG